jgi:MYXO-CTERM domain-containing protein
MTPVSMAWMGGQLWRAEVPDVDAVSAEVCATDRAGNTTCLTVFEAEPADTDSAPDPESDGCGCTVGAPQLGWLALIGLVVARRAPTRPR